MATIVRATAAPRLNRALARGVDAGDGGGPTGGFQFDGGVDGMLSGVRLAAGGLWGGKFGGIVSYTSTSFQVRIELMRIILLVSS